MPDADDALRRLVAEQRRAEAADRRRRRHGLDQVERASATTAGILRDLAEAGAPVALGTAAADLRGVIDALGSDVVVLRGPQGGVRRVLVPLGGVRTIRTASAGPAPTGGRGASAPTSLISVLRTAVEDAGPTGCEVTIVLGDATAVAGRMWLAGEDVVGLLGPHGRTYVALRHIDHLCVR